MMQPPGKRMKPGCMSLRSWARSGRRPVGRWCKVEVGERETMARARTAVGGEAEGVGVVGVGGLVGLDGGGGGGVAGLDGGPAHEGVVELEGAIFDALGVEAAVGGEVDVFEEDAGEGGGDRGAGAIDGDG